MEPIRIEQVRRCHFKEKPCKECGRPHSAHRKFDDSGCAGFRRQQGCEHCGLAKADLAHFGAPPSYNAVGTGRGSSGAAMVGANLKQAWERLLRELLAESGLPKSLGGVYVEGEITFPDRSRRDQGNYRVILEKALGDALVKGGWLKDDDWTRYEFGQLTQRYQLGESATRLTIFPRDEARQPAVDQQHMEIA